MGRPNFGNKGGYRQKKGDFRYIDDRSGFYSWGSQGQLEWDLLRTDNADIRNPQDYVRGVPDLQNNPWVRTQTPNQFLEFAIFTSQGLPLIASDGSALLATAPTE